MAKDNMLIQSKTNQMRSNKLCADGKYSMSAKVATVENSRQQNKSLAVRDAVAAALAKGEPVYLTNADTSGHVERIVGVVPDANMLHLEQQVKSGEIVDTRMFMVQIQNDIGNQFDIYLKGNTEWLLQLNDAVTLTANLKLHARYRRRTNPEYFTIIALEPLE